MANSAWQATIQNAAGDIVPGAEITVIDEGTGLNAVIFSSKAGAALTNPFNADAGGFAQFYSGPGEYRITAFDIGTGLTQTFDNWRLGDAGARDVGIGTDEVPLNSDLGTASTRDTGTGTGEVPLAEDSWNDLTVEHGTNANGEYWKYPDGSLECSINRNETATITTAFGPVYFASSVVWNYPVSFIGSLPIISESVLDGAGSLIWTSSQAAQSTSLTSHTSTLISPTSRVSATYNICKKAKGNWL